MKKLWFVCIWLTVFQLFATYAQIPITDSSKINPLKSEYEQWIKPYKLNSIANRFSTDQTPPKLILSIVTERMPSPGKLLNGFSFPTTT